VPGAKPLKAVAAGRPVVLGVPLALPRQAREGLCQLAFEQLGAKALFLGSTAFLSVLGAGQATGVLLDVGEAGACAVPFVEGYPLAQCAARSSAGGALLSAGMAGFLQEAGAELPDGGSWPVAGREVKEQLAYVAPCFAEELQQLHGGKLSPQRCELPGGVPFQAARGEGFRCGELLFDPSSASSGGQPPGEAGAKALGIHELVVSSLRLQSDVNLRGRLLDGGLLLAGGSSLLKGLPERLLSEVRLQSPWVAPGKKPEEVQLHAPVERGSLAWQGGAALAECDVLRQLWTTRAQYREEGPGAIHRTFL